MSGLSSGDLFVSSWGSDDEGQRLWKATHGDRVAFFSTPLDADTGSGAAVLITLAEAVLGLPLSANALTILEHPEPSC